MIKSPPSSRQEAEDADLEAAAAAALEAVKHLTAAGDICGTAAALRVLIKCKPVSAASWPSEDIRHDMKR